jgi:hypothetical protein
MNSKIIIEESFIFILILFLIWAFVGLFLSLQPLETFSSIILSVNVENSASLFLVSSQILATVFAITVSLSVLGFQYLSTSYSPILLKKAMRERTIQIMFTIYILAILLNMFFLIFPDIIELQKQVFFSYILFSGCIFYLVFYLRFIIKKMQPTNVIKAVRNKIPKDFKEKIINKSVMDNRVIYERDEAFITLEQIIIKSIKDNDFFGFLNGLEIMFKELNDCLSKISGKLKKDENYDLVLTRTDSVIGYFFRYLDQIKNECLECRREEFLTNFSFRLKKIIIILIELKAIRALREMKNIFEDTGYSAIDYKLKSFLNNYIISLRDIIKKEIEITDYQHIINFEEDIQSYNSLSKDEKQKRSLNHILFNYFAFDRMRSIKRMCIKSSENNLGNQTNLFFSLFHDIIEHTIRIKNNPMRRSLMGLNIIPTLVKTHKKCIDNNINGTISTTSLLYFLIEKMSPEVLRENGSFLVESYCEMMLYSIKNRFFDEVFDLGINGRMLARTHPKLARIIIKTLKSSSVVISKIKLIEETEKQNLNKTIKLEIKSINNGINIGVQIEKKSHV